MMWGAGDTPVPSSLQTAHHHHHHPPPSNSSRQHASARSARRSGGRLRVSNDTTTDQTDCLPPKRHQQSTGGAPIVASRLQNKPAAADDGAGPSPSGIRPRDEATPSGSEPSGFGPDLDTAPSAFALCRLLPNPQSPTVEGGSSKGESLSKGGSSLCLDPPPSLPQREGGDHHHREATGSPRYPLPPFNHPRLSSGSLILGGGKAAALAAAISSAGTGAALHRGGSHLRLQHGSPDSHQQGSSPLGSISSSTTPPLSGGRFGREYAPIDHPW